MSGLSRLFLQQEHVTRLIPRRRFDQTERLDLHAAKLAQAADCKSHLSVDGRLQHVLQQAPTPTCFGYEMAGEEADEGLATADHHTTRVNHADLEDACDGRARRLRPTSQRIAYGREAEVALELYVAQLRARKVECVPPRGFLVVRHDELDEHAPRPARIARPVRRLVSGRDNDEIDSPASRRRPSRRRHPLAVLERDQGSLIVERIRNRTQNDEHSAVLDECLNRRNPSCFAHGDFLSPTPSEAGV